MVNEKLTSLILIFFPNLAHGLAHVGGILPFSKNHFLPALARLYPSLEMGGLLNRLVARIASHVGLRRSIKPFTPGR